jgi:hypothetical protein
MAEKHDDHAHGHGGHAEHDGGHEIDKMPNARLFNLLFGLSGLTLLACIGVIQLFNLQVDAIEQNRAEAGSFRIESYREEMRKQIEGWGKLEVKEPDDNSVSTRYYMPIAQAKKKVLDEPKLLEAAPKYPGWKTSDEQAPAAAAAPEPEKAPQQLRPAPPRPTPDEKKDEKAP